MRLTGRIIPAIPEIIPKFSYSANRATVRHYYTPEQIKKRNQVELEAQRNRCGRVKEMVQRALGNTYGLENEISITPVSPDCPCIVEETKKLERSHWVVLPPNDICVDAIELNRVTVKARFYLKGGRFRKFLSPAEPCLVPDEDSPDLQTGYY